MWYLACIFAACWVLLGLNDPCLPWSVLFQFWNHLYIWYAILVLASICVGGLVSIIIALYFGHARQNNNDSTKTTKQTTISDKNYYYYYHCDYHDDRTKDWPLDILMSGVCFGVGYLFCGHTIHSAIITALLPVHHTPRGANVWILLTCMWIGVCCIRKYSHQRRSIVVSPSKTTLLNSSIETDPDGEDRPVSMIIRVVKIFFVFSIFIFLIWHSWYFFKPLQQPSDDSIIILPHAPMLLSYGNYSSPTHRFLLAWCSDERHETTLPFAFDSIASLFFMIVRGNHQQQIISPSQNQLLGVMSRGKESYWFFVILMGTALISCSVGVVYCVIKINYDNLNQCKSDQHSGNILQYPHSNLLHHMLQYAYDATVYIFVSICVYYLQLQAWVISCIILDRRHDAVRNYNGDDERPVMMKKNENPDTCEYDDHNTNNDILFGYIIGIYTVLLIQICTPFLVQLYTNSANDNSSIAIHSIIYEFIKTCVRLGLASTSTLFVPVWAFPWQVQVLQIIGATLIGISTALWERRSICISPTKINSTSMYDTKRYNCVVGNKTGTSQTSPFTINNVSEHVLWYGSMLLTVTAMIASQIK